jgi:hypothetical protein
MYRFAVPMLLSATCAVACGQGSGATVGDMGPGPGPDGAGTGSTVGGASGSGAGATGLGGTGGSAITTAGGTDSSGGASPSGGSGAVGGASGAAGAGGAGGSTTMGAAGMNSGAGPWGTPVSGGPTASGTMVTANVTVNPSSIKGNVGQGFAGFSMEKTHITNSSLTGSNANLIALFKLVGPTSLRIGANDVDRCSWAPTTKPGGGGPPYGFSVGTAMVDQLADFLTATGAKIIYGVNFFANNVSNTTAEVTYAASKLGSSVSGFELGNEINKYGTWAAQKTEWENFGTSITGAAPSALLIGPACTSGGASTFTTPFAADESAKFGAKLTLLTHHYYAGGAGSTNATVSTLQTVKTDIASIGSVVDTAVTKNKIPNGWRMGEANTFSGHGQMGVSDTLIAGLWSLDFMFVNALNGASGVNFHGGETGMDGTKPFYYEPIMENDGAVVGVMPVYYGMLLFYLAGQGQVLDTTVTSGDANLNAYTIDYKADGSKSVVLVNKNGSTGVQATINLGSAVTSASAIYLQGTPAGSLNAPSNAVTLAGAAVSPAGVWNRGAPFTQSTSGNTVSVFVPPATAALVRVQ